MRITEYGVGIMGEAQFVGFVGFIEVDSRITD